MESQILSEILKSTDVEANQILEVKLIGDRFSNEVRAELLFSNASPNPLNSSSQQNLVDDINNKSLTFFLSRDDGTVEEIPKIEDSASPATGTVSAAIPPPSVSPTLSPTTSLSGNNDAAQTGELNEDEKLAIGLTIGLLLLVLCLILGVVVAKKMSERERDPVAPSTEPNTGIPPAAVTPFHPAHDSAAAKRAKRDSLV